MKNSIEIILSVIVASCLLTACQDKHPVKGAEKMSRSEKRGVAFSLTRSDDLSLLCPYISWDYNWGNDATSDAAMWFQVYNVDFCPMCWSGSYSKDKIRKYVAANPSTKYLLGFNEPNLQDQANMTPDQAAALWPDVVALANELGLKIVAPAMNYGTVEGYSDPIKWLDEFFAKPGVDLNDISALSLHCYMKSPAAVKSYIERFSKYNKPIWLTEFCAWDGGVSNVEQQMSYMCNVLNYLEQEANVERYAWFIPRYKTPGTEPFMQLLTNAPDIQLTDLGQMYTQFSTFDKNVFIMNDRYIYAGEYVSTSDMNVQVRPCKDATVGTDGLMITSSNEGVKISYQVAVAEDASELELRYTSYSNTIMKVSLDGKEDFLDMPRTGSLDSWQSAMLRKVIPAGNHTISIELVSGTCYISGLMVK